ncbi:hypothetical protein IQ07DRAFT_586785 [Pyrenochaeta sp. DS3sAY3a]|nr:hypothetical protein IQ07DRAFT_586785 [Pyrenochaeta sp. DS3sAY3a]
MSPIPIIVCGRNPAIAKNVRKGLEPEYDVIHIVLTPEQGISDIPPLLSGQKLSTTPINLGSQNYAQKPVAVALGGGFSDDQFQQIRDACKDSPAIWMRTDMTRFAEMPDLGDVEAYGAAVAERAKSRMGELGVGREGGKVEGEFYF